MWQIWTLGNKTTVHLKRKTFVLTELSANAVEYANAHLCLDLVQTKSSFRLSLNFDAQIKIRT